MPDRLIPLLLGLCALWVFSEMDCAGYRDVLTQDVFVRQLIRQAQKPESSCKFSRTFI